MRLTNSQDNKLRANLNVKIRSGYDDFFSFVAYSLVNGEEDKVPTDNRAKFIEAFKDAIRARGEHAMHYWADNIDRHDNTFDDTIKQASEIVVKLFPELMEDSKK